MNTKEIRLKVPAKRYRFMMQLLDSLPFVEVEDEATTEAERQQTIANIEQGFRELKLMQEGKLESRPIEDVLRELAD